MNTKQKIVSTVAASTLVVAQSSEAALNSAVSTAFSGLQTDALAIVDLAWPVAIAVTVAFILIGLFKRGARSAV